MSDNPVILNYPSLSRKKDNEKKAKMNSFSKKRGVIDYIIYYYHIIIQLSQKERTIPIFPLALFVRDNVDNGIMKPLFTSEKAIIPLIIPGACNGQSLKKTEL